MISAHLENIGLLMGILRHVTRMKCADFQSKVRICQAPPHLNVRGIL